MSDVTQILNRVQQGDPRAAEELLPLVYDELRKLAAARMSKESAEQTLQPTALVHEAWLRLAGGAEQHWNSRGHFLAPRPRPCDGFWSSAPAKGVACGTAADWKRWTGNM